MAGPALVRNTPTPPSEDPEIAYWICPPREAFRHATTQRPGALQHGSTITALGGCDLKIPWPTPYGATPRCAHVIDECPKCAKAVLDQGLVSRTWDF